MGMDISGINPVIHTPKPQRPKKEFHEDKEAWELYFEEQDKWRESNPGDYFRSNLWGWRPIVMLCQVANEKYDLDLNFEYWGSNDGAGLKNQRECDKLADGLEGVLIGFFDMNEVDEVQICLGSWVNSMTNQFVSSEISKELNEEYPEYTILTTSVVLDDGTTVKSSHSVDKSHVERFIRFLRECGGFEIW